MSSIIDDIIFGNTETKDCPNCGKGDSTKLPIKCCQDGICAVKYCSILIVRLPIVHSMKKNVGNVLQRLMMRGLYRNMAELMKLTTLNN